MKTDCCRTILGRPTSPRHSRRDLLLDGMKAVTACSIGGSVAPLLASAGETGGGASGREYVDAHVHVWTPDVAKYPLADAFQRDEMKPPSFTPEQLFAHSRLAGVGRVVLIQMSFYGFDNRYMLDTIDRHPAVFVGVAVIDDRANRPQDEMRKLKRQGVAGFRLVTHDVDAEKWFATPGIRDMWKCGSEERLAMCMLCDADVLPAIDRMCEQYPNTPVVIDHIARIGVYGTIRDNDVEQLCRLARHEHTYVKLSAFYALGKRQPPYLDMVPTIRRVFDAFGPQRLMWASDCPFQVDTGHTYQESVDLVAKHLDFATAEDRQWLMTKTAERFFFAG